MLKSAIHIHSTYSDGEFSLAELRQIFLAQDCRLVFMTDHAEAFDEAKLQRYICECQELSDDQFRFVAGLEFECENRLHILGLGVTDLVQTTNPEAVIRHIRLEKGISVIAHPLESMFEWIANFTEMPDGVETWNTKYDGRFAPRPITFKFLYNLQKKYPRVKAFYGQDLHWKNQHRGLFTLLFTDLNPSSNFISYLNSGDYIGIKDGLEMPSNGFLQTKLLDSFQSINNRSMKRRRLLKRVKKQLDRFGVGIPASLKTQLRRVF